jgi:hypothetical protein
LQPLIEHLRAEATKLAARDPRRNQDEPTEQTDE